MPDLSALPGVAALRSLTRGDARVIVAVLDGLVAEHPALENENVSVVRGYWIDEEREAESWSTAHATHIGSVIMGSDSSDAPGFAPNCRGLLVAAGVDEETAESEIGIARAIEFALSKGAQIIHCAFCHPNQTGHAQDLLARAVRKAEEMGAVIIAPAGNDYGENWCVPSSLPTVLAVGALADDGAPMHFTNFGELYDGHSIMGPGENVHGADSKGGTVLQKGTSVAAPVLSGIIAALTSACVQAGQPIAPQRVRDVLIATARPCTGAGADRCIGGEVAVDRAMAVLLDGMSIEQARRAFPDGPTAPDAPPALSVPPRVAHAPLPPHSIARHAPHPVGDPREEYKREERVVDGVAVVPSAVEPSLRYPSMAFPIGQVSYEFPDELTRESFARAMGSRLSPDDGAPFDVEALIAYLDDNVAEARRLRWVVSINGERRYAVTPVGAFAAQIFDMLAALVLGEARGDITVSSLPGWTTDTTVELMDGTVVRELRMNSLRGVYGWHSAQIARQSAEAVHRDALAGQVGRMSDRSQPGETTAIIAGDGTENAVLGLSESPVVSWPRLREAPSDAVVEAIDQFLHQVYFRDRQEPEISRDRAVNFAATNGYQVAAAFMDAMTDGFEYAQYRTQYSPFARVSGLCWDVVVQFTDPSEDQRAMREYRLTVDIADVMPVTVGRLRRWSAGPGSDR